MFLYSNLGKTESLGSHYLLKIGHGHKNLKDKGAFRQRADCMCIIIEKYMCKKVYLDILLNCFYIAYISCFMLIV